MFLTVDFTPLTRGINKHIVFVTGAAGEAGDVDTDEQEISGKQLVPRPHRTATIDWSGLY